MSTEKSTKNQFDEITSRIMELKGYRYESQVAEFLGLDKTAYSQRKKRDSIPVDKIATACNVWGWDFNWVMYGKKTDNTAGVVAETSSDYVAMPVRVLAGAGDPCDLELLEPIDQIIVKKDLDGPHIQVVEIRGKSMEPSIVHGARVGVDTSDKTIISGEIYACYMRHEGIVVKRIIMGPDTVTIKSDNPAFPDQEVLIDRIDWQNFIQGRVKWILQKYI